jgi:outer membrane receptor protein involved in Fe transport
MTPRPFLTSLLLVASAGLSAHGQTPPTGSPAARDDQPIVLSEFRVDTTKDRGYLATNATTGTRLNMPIKQIPMPIEVVTREFIDDIGAVDIKEALQYSAGIVQDYLQSSNNFTFSPSGTGQATGALSRDSAAVNIRGFNTRSFLRSGFRQDTVTDVVNVDRQEIARGPQSLLYGIAALGGIVNITPKYPRAKPFSSVRVGLGNNDFYRAEAYTTGPVLSRSDSRRYLNYGVGFVYQNTSSPDDFDDRRRLLVTPAVEFKPFESTNIFVDVEYGQFRSDGNGFKDIGDANAGNVRNSYGLRVAENVNEYNEGINVARHRFGRDRFFRWSGEDTFAKDDYFSGTIEVTQKLLPGLTLVGSANYSDRQTTRRSLDSQGVVTSNTASAATAPTALGVWTNVGPNPATPAQTYWKTINYQWANGPTHKLIRQTRFDLNYEFSLFGNKQSVLAGRQDQTVTQSAFGTAQVSSNVTGGTNRSFIAFDNLAYLRYQGEQTRIFRDDQFSEWNTGHYAIYQGRWWQDRITAIGGLRWDRYMVRDLAYTYVKADPTQPDANVANWVRPATFDASANSAPGGVPKVNGYRFGGNVQRDTNPTFGVSAAITKDISLYAVSAGGIFPNTGQRNGAGEPFQAEKTKSKELGVKLDLWKDTSGRARVSASGAFFRIERENGIYNLFWAPQPRSNNQATLRAGFTANTLVSGTGPNAYAVTNSAYTTFQTNRPVTYLLPVGYVAAADLNHPRVAGAPQQGGYIFVDYASLGTAAADPLRRAMDAAGADGANFTAMQAATVGSGATAFNANNGYALNRNSDTSYNDQTEGFDIQLYFNLTENYSAVFTYTYLTQGVTGGFRVADQPNSTEYDSWWNYMGIPFADRRGNLDEASHDFSGQILGARTIDNPRNAFALWNKYTFASGALKGLDLGLGVTVNGPRQSQVAINNGARNLQLLENQRLRPEFSTDYKVNLGIGYRTRRWDRPWNFRLNVNNVLNEQKKSAFGSSVLYINPADGALVASTVAGAQKITVPERAVRYFEPISFRLVASTSF